MTNVSLKIKTSYHRCLNLSLSVSRVASKIGNNKQHKTVINKQLTQAVFFCKILKLLSGQNAPSLNMEWDSM